MTRKDITETIELPAGVTATVQADQVTVKGPKGELTRSFPAQGFTITADQQAITLGGEQITQQQKNKLFTYKAHLNNMVKGVQEGFLYKLKICSGHFPMSVNVKDGKIEIKNFIGEKVPRSVPLKKGAEVKIDGDVIEVRSNDKELAGQVAADIEKLTRRPGFDKRVFQDGIYITEKAGRHA